jgi:hypothetical protein
MVISIPRDYQSYPVFRLLTAKMDGDEVWANHLFMRLWVELGYQCDLHEQPGMFDRGCIESFNHSVHRPDAFAILLEVNLLHSRDEDYYCLMFAKANQELNPDLLPDHQRRELLGRFSKKREVAASDAAHLIPRLPDEVWLTETGERMTLEQMKRCITFIKTTDSVQRMKARQKNEFTVGLVHDAYRIITRFTDVQLDVILKRLYFARARKLSTHVPRNTGDLLRRFEEILYVLLPDEGFIRWDKGKVYEARPEKT